MKTSSADSMHQVSSSSSRFALDEGARDAALTDSCLPQEGECVTGFIGNPVPLSMGRHGEVRGVER